jgi:hypothetical protein
MRLFLNLIKPQHEDIMREWRYSSTILDLVTRWRRKDSFIKLGEKPPVPAARGLAGS